MAAIMNSIDRLVRRDDDTTCDSGNDYDGRMGIRIASIFVILVGSLLGATLPIFLQGDKNSRSLRHLFFFFKYFGSGVIVATAFIHLLSPAVEALTDPCLSGAITDYPWYAGIMLMGIFMCFFVELMIMKFKAMGSCGGHAHRERSSEDKTESEVGVSMQHRRSNVPGEDHLGHSREHMDVEDAMVATYAVNEYSAQITAVLILEFGVIFHSIFIGLTLAVAGDELTHFYAEGTDVDNSSSFHMDVFWSGIDGVAG
ncbi:MAG: hypothetical protein Q9160_008764 [Pyrenula sp. 1 TL-2023]